MSDTDANQPAMSTLFSRYAPSAPTHASQATLCARHWHPTKPCKSAMTAFMTVCILALYLAGLIAVADEKAGHQIHGTIVMDPTVSYEQQPDERLVIKFYFPDQGIEKDQTFRIFNEFSFPFDFHNGPDLDMSRRTKWPFYVVEAFTDIDGDVLTIGKKEYFATSSQPVAIGSEGLVLKLIKK